MHAFYRPLSGFLLLLLTCTACNSVPDHARFIPVDAVVVAGVNTRQIGREIAWSALTGSALFQKLKARLPQQRMIESLGEAGIRHQGTSYIYVRPGEGPTAGRIAALIPLEDAGKWEDWVRKNIPDAGIRQLPGRREANLFPGMYAGWTRDLLIVLNLTDQPQATIRLQASDTGFGPGFPDADRVGAEDSLRTAGTGREHNRDPQLLADEMEAAFALPGDKGLAGDGRFKDLESQGHDLTLWINYEALMAKDGAALEMPAGLSLGKALWQGSAFSGGFDFEKGKITGELKYYTPEHLKAISRKFAGKAADQDLIDRLPARDLNMMMAMHLSPEAVKALLEQLGVLGFANLALSAEGLHADDLLQAFTGDIGWSVNGLQVSYADRWYATKDSSIVISNSHSTDFEFVYAMKIGSRERLDKLIKYLLNKHILQTLEQDVFLAAGEDTVFILKGGQYLVAASNLAAAKAYQEGKNKPETKPAPLREQLSGKTVGLYVDFRNILKGTTLHNGGTGSDAAVLAESRRLLDYLVFSGGDYRQQAFAYGLELHLVDKKENSIFQIMNLALGLSGRDTTAGGRDAGLQPL